MNGGPEPGRSDRIEALWEAAVALFLLRVPGSLVLQVLSRLSAVPAGPADGPAWTELRFCLQGLNCLLVIAWMLWRRVPLGRVSVWSSTGLYLLFLAAWIPFVTFGYMWLLQLVGESFEPQSHLLYFVEGDPGRAGLWASLLVVSLLGPIGEEIVFRGHLYGALKALLGIRGALLLTSAFFGLIHGWQYALPLGLLGLFFGWLRERSGGIAAPIMVHILHNTLTVTVAILAPSLLDPFGQR